MVMAVAAALLPVLLFLALLVVLDSFKLVPPRSVGRTLAAGAAVALACLPLNGWAIELSGLAITSRYLAPLLEETLKAAVVVAIIWRRGAGFLVDAAIVGFAVGSGFAVVENLQYLWAMRDGTLGVWMVRGFGTAILHGANTAIVSILLQQLLERHDRRRALDLVPGWAIAVAIHSAFNHVLLPPVAATLVLLLVLPPIVLLIFERSERATREWIHGGMDVDLESLSVLLSKDFDASRAGAYLRELKTRFPGPVVADMFCLVRLDLELAIRARGLLMAREAGIELPADDTLSARLEERRYLRHAIGRTALLALRPLQPAAGRDEWQTSLLDRAATRG